MSHSPSYSPVLDIIDPRNVENVIEDSDPVTNPFNYAQDRESWYMEVAAKACEESRQQKTEKKSKSSRLHEGGSVDLSEKDQTVSPYFFYPQGNEKSYIEKLLDQQRSEKLLHTSLNDQAQTKSKLKRKRDYSSSYIARRDKSGARGRYVIKINIHELTDCDPDCSDSDDASVSVQYIVCEPFDEVMDATQALVRKICNKLE